MKPWCQDQGKTETFEILFETRLRLSRGRDVKTETSSMGKGRRGYRKIIHIRDIGTWHPWFRSEVKKL